MALSTPSNAPLSSTPATSLRTAFEKLSLELRQMVAAHLEGEDLKQLRLASRACNEGSFYYDRCGRVAITLDNAGLKNLFKIAACREVRDKIKTLIIRFAAFDAAFIEYIDDLPLRAEYQERQLTQLRLLDGTNGSAVLQLLSQFPQLRRVEIVEPSPWEGFCSGGQVYYGNRMYLSPEGPSARVTDDNNTHLPGSSHREAIYKIVGTMLGALAGLTDLGVLSFGIDIIPCPLDRHDLTPSVDSMNLLMTNIPGQSVEPNALTNLKKMRLIFSDRNNLAHLLAPLNEHVTLLRHVQDTLQSLELTCYSAHFAWAVLAQAKFPALKSFKLHFLEINRGPPVSLSLSSFLVRHKETLRKLALTECYRVAYQGSAPYRDVFARRDLLDFLHSSVKSWRYDTLVMWLPRMSFTLEWAGEKSGGVAMTETLQQAWAKNAAHYPDISSKLTFDSA